MDNSDLEEACINKGVVDKFYGKFMFVERAFEKSRLDQAQMEAALQLAVQCC